MHDKNVIMVKMARSGDNLSLGDDIFPIRQRVRGGGGCGVVSPSLKAPLRDSDSFNIRRLN